MLFCQAQKILDLVIIQVAHQHGVQLQILKSGILRCPDARKGVIQISPAGDFPESLRPQGIQTDVQPVHSGFLQGLYGTGLILIIVFVVRSLPTGTRSGISALRQIDKSIEESAYDMGADSFKVFMTVTLPLIKDSFLSGLVTAFVRSITAISAIILLVTPQFLLITVQINEFAEKGSYSLACAFATILIVITYGAVLLMNLFMNHFGTSKKMKED